MNRPLLLVFAMALVALTVPSTSSPASAGTAASLAARDAKVTADASMARSIGRPGVANLDYPPGLVSYWTFDEGSGTAAYDAFGTNHGAIHGATWTSGQVGGALHFSWDQWVEVPDAPSLNPQTAMSVEGWVQIDSPPGWLYKIFDKDGYWSTYRGYSGTISAEPLLSFQLFGNGQVSYSPPGGFPDVWFHFAMVHDGNVATVYFNGVPSASQPIAGPINQGANRPLYIGREDGASEFMNGKIDELALYDRALTAAEVAEHYARSLAGQSYFDGLVSVQQQTWGAVKLRYRQQGAAQPTPKGR